MNPTKLRILVAAFAGMLGTASANEAAPNILFIFTDDQSFRTVNGIKWEKVWFEREGTQRYTEGLRLAKCDARERYPLLADTSNSSGVPRARFSSDEQYKFAMRYQGKGPVFFLDGSTNLVGHGEMGRFGINLAYLFEKNPTDAPSLVAASSGSN